MTSARSLVPFVLLAVAALPLAAQDVQVTAADPSSSAQGTLNLDVKITGKGFKQSAQAQFFLTGTTNPGGVVVHSTTFVSPTQLTANIDVPDTAAIGGFDIQVVIYSTGRSGKGIDLFSVTAKGSNACLLDPLDSSSFTLLNTLTETPPAESKFATTVRAKKIILGGVPVVVAAVGSGASDKVEVYFLDPVTAQVLDGQVIGSNTQPQPHLSMVVDPSIVANVQRMEIGEINRDGIPDIVAGANTGMAYAFLSSVTGGVLNYSAGIPLVPSTPSNSYADYGMGVAVGDLDGVAGDEVAVGATAWSVTGKNAQSPKVFLFKWNGSGFAQYQALTGTAHYFGTSLAIGDVTGDAAHDLIIGTLNSGAYVFPGPPSNSNFFVLGAAGALGYQNAIANVDGGLYPDLLSSTWFATPTQAQVFTGLVGGGQSPSITLAPVAGLDAGWGTTDFGIGDINGDGLVDILMGAPNALPSAGCPGGTAAVGAAYVFLSNAANPLQPVRYGLRPPTYQPGTTDVFGWSVAAVDGTRIFLVGDKGRGVYVYTMH